MLWALHLLIDDLSKESASHLAKFHESGDVDNTNLFAAGVVDPNVLASNTVVDANVAEYCQV